MPVRFPFHPHLSLSHERHCPYYKILRQKTPLSSLTFEPVSTKTQQCLSSFNTWARIQLLMKSHHFLPSWWPKFHAGPLLTEGGKDCCSESLPCSQELPVPWVRKNRSGWSQTNIWTQIRTGIRTQGHSQQAGGPDRHIIPSRKQADNSSTPQWINWAPAMCQELFWAQGTQ
jgi:hypothetical protein